MPEGCPLDPDRESYVQAEIPERCLGCIAIAQEMGTMRPVISKSNEEKLRLIGAEINEQDKFERVGITRPTKSDIRLYSVEHYLQSSLEQTSPLPLREEIYAFTCAYQNQQ